ncbi:MAG: SUF system NifU family Fe-S cluster assembly protein [Chloroflexi bacterium]|nr:SUF system NifU family Fe-S cluster assembly protein [Chloroflexota bacterium]
MPALDVDDLYRAILLDHYRNPRRRGRLTGEGVVSADGANPLCGDQLTVDVRLDDRDHLVEVAFEGAGCSISQASASLMMEYVAGRSAGRARAGVDAFQEMMTSGAAPEDFGDLEALAGVAKFPVRIKCASLGWKTLEQALLAAGRGDARSADRVTTDERSSGDD